MVTQEIIRNAGFFVDGLAYGAILAMLGLGITMVWGMGGVLNLALGVFSVLAVLIAFEVLGIVDNLFIAIMAGLIAAGALALIVDRSLLSLVYRSEGEERILLGIFVTLGLAIFLDGLLTNLYRSQYSVSSGVGSQRIFGVLVRGSSIAIMAVAVLVFALLYLFFSRTYLGGAARTVMQDETGAILCGIKPRRMRTMIFVLSASIAGIAGIAYSFTSEVSVYSAFELTVLAIIVSIVGGVTSIVGAVIAGLFLGIVSVFTSAYIGAYVAEVVLLGVAVVVLVMRPEQIE